MIGELGPISHKIQYQIAFKSAEATRLLNRKLVDCQCQFLTIGGDLYEPLDAKNQLTVEPTRT